MESERKSSGLTLTRLDTVTPEPVRWLWANRIPLGKMTLIVGPAGLGKTFLTLDIAARVSAGDPWPDAPDKPIKRGAVIIMTAEDDTSDTIVPRLMAAGSDLEHVSCLEDHSFTLKKDHDRLAQLLDENPDVRLLIIDPINAFLGNVNSHNDAEVRTVLSPLAKVAAEHKVAVICIMHHNKAQNVAVADKIMGSVAFNAAARQVWHIVEDPDDSDKRLLVSGKHNLTKASSGLRFKLESVGEGEGNFPSARVIFDREPVLKTAQDILSEEVKQGQKTTKTERAIEFLLRILKENARDKHDVERMAEEESISTSTLRRAKEQLGVVSRQEGIGDTRRSLWSLPKEIEV